MQKLLEGLALIFGVSVLIAVVVVILPYSLDLQAKVDCNELKSQSQSGLRGFFITSSEDAQCRSLGIIINAPVR